eukprot:GEMP01045727.1.p1 GENE.GEMP01045727.1~~GEMP01045727.1.p1  ORF type:complete len:306 (+),score=88.37 GEMP01045727.1:88-1005(+)
MEWKWRVRHEVWDEMESRGVAAFPLPPHHRIPNFVNSEQTAGPLSKLTEYQRARCIKVNPDTPQKSIRELALRDGKRVIVPAPRLKEGFFSALDNIPLNKVHFATTQDGARQFGAPLSLDSVEKVDLVVIGSVAVDPMTGRRIGKGEGYAELEWAILYDTMKAIHKDTIVVTTCHDCQLKELPVEGWEVYDVPVDVIITPSQTIRVHTTIPKPDRIFWDKLPENKLDEIKVLRDLKTRVERELGHALVLAPRQPPHAKGSQKGRGKATKGGKKDPRATGVTDDTGVPPKKRQPEEKERRWRRKDN